MATGADVARAASQEAHRWVVPGCVGRSGAGGGTAEVGYAFGGELFG
ncbi:hypothetical protein [Rhodococcus marinonascens]|nr:hypothetical protein [Rhodococcus marinonascens]